MSEASDSIIMQGTKDRCMAELQAEITRVKSENSKVNTEYKSLKFEVIKAVQGKARAYGSFIRACQSKPKQSFLHRVNG